MSPYRRMQHLARRPDSQQFMKFGIIGLSSTALNFLLYSAMVLNDVPYLLAALISFTLCTFYGYTLNRRWTFQMERGRKRLVKFFVVQTVGLIINLVALAILVEFAGFGEHKLIAQLLANSLVVFSNFLGNKFWTFR